MQNALCERDRFFAATNALVTPSPVFIYEGEDVVMSVNSLGELKRTDRLTYQWYYYDENDERVDIQGATGSTYTVRNVLENCEYCVVKDWWGDFGGVPVLASSDVPTCTKWGSGDCMTSFDGYCFMAKKKEEKKNEHCEGERPDCLSECEGS